MKTIAIIERGKDGSFGIYTPDLESTISGNGRTLDEAKKDFEDAYHEALEVFAEMGSPVPEELKDLEFEYRYDTASVLTAVSKYISLSALAKETGINASLLRQYKQGQYISAAQAQKIQSGIRSMSKRIASFTLL